MKDWGGWEYIDPVAAVVAAIVLAILAGLGVVKKEVLAAAALAVIAGVAAVLIRERYIVEQVKKTLDQVPATFEAVQEAVDAANQTVEAIASGEPYYVLEQEASWEIIAEDGSLARATRRKRLRFNQDDVVSVYERSGTTGGRPGRIEDWRFNPDSVEMVGGMTIEGDDYVLISLGARFRRNQEFEYESERAILDTFTDEANFVKIRVRETTHRLKLRVVWSKDVPLRRVRIEEVTPDGKSLHRELPLAQIDRIPEPDGRPFYERTYANPLHNQAFVVGWWVRKPTT